MLAMRTYRSRVLNLARSRTPDDPDLLAARRDLTYCQLMHYAAEATTGANPLPVELVDTAIEILTVGRGRRGA